MRLVRIIAAMMVFLGMAFIAACGEEETSSLEGNEDIAAVIQKITQCYENPEVAVEIYTNDAVLKRQDPTSLKMIELTGPKEIEEYRKERGKSFYATGVSISSIKTEATTAHVEYVIITRHIQRYLEWQLRSSAEMVKEGQMWKIKVERTKAF